MSVNARNSGNPFYFSDPFLCCSKIEGLDDASRLGPWGSLSLLSTHSPFDISFGDQFCPSSSPSSPSSVANLSSPLFYSYEDLKESSSFVKEEPFDDFYLDDPFQTGHFTGIPHVDSASEVFSSIPELAGSTVDPELDERYEDFMQILNIETSSLFCPPLSVHASIMDVEESDGGAASTPSGSVSGTGSNKRKISRAKVSRSKKAIIKKSGSGSPDLSSVCEKLKSFKNSPESSRRTSPSSSQSTSMSVSTSDEEGGSRKHSKRSSKSGSPDAYVRRREKNNIAVRKSREKKRQEIKKFADEHSKLKREIDNIRAQNEKLRNLVVAVEEGIVVEKSKSEMESMIKAAKKQLNWC